MSRKSSRRGSFRDAVSTSVSPSPAPCDSPIARYADGAPVEALRSTRAYQYTGIAITNAQRSWRAWHASGYLTSRVKGMLGRDSRNHDAQLLGGSTGIQNQRRCTMLSNPRDAQWKGTKTANATVGATKNSTERNKMKPEDLEITKRRGPFHGALLQTGISSPPLEHSRA